MGVASVLTTRSPTALMLRHLGSIWAIADPAAILTQEVEAEEEAATAVTHTVIPTAIGTLTAAEVTVIKTGTLMVETAETGANAVAQHRPAVGVTRRITDAAEAIQEVRPEEAVPPVVAAITMLLPQHLFLLWRRQEVILPAGKRYRDLHSSELTCYLVGPRFSSRRSRAKIQI